jgi:opacity protein-like surface antigen
MKMKAILLAVCFAAVLAIGVNSAVADDMVPGAYAQQDQSVMGVGQTMMQMGAKQRALTDATNRASRAHMSRSVASGINVDQQFGSSQSDQSWKAAKTIEEANMQTGIIAGDCRGENSDGKYRKQMNQNRKGYMKENLVPNSMCSEIHPTLK